MVVSQFGEMYPELREKEAFIVGIIKDEEEAFSSMLVSGETPCSNPVDSNNDYTTSVSCKGFELHGYYSDWATPCSIVGHCVVKFYLPAPPRTGHLSVADAPFFGCWSSGFSREGVMRDSVALL